LMTGCNLTPVKNSWSITNCNSIVNRHECHQVLTASMPLSRHGQSQQRGSPPILAFKQVEWTVTSSSQPHNIGPTVCPTSQPSKNLGSCRKGYLSKTHHSNSSIEFECTDTSRVLISLCCMQWPPAAASHATITRVWRDTYKHLHKHVQTSL
jgi:hypothetical protein